MADHDSIVSSDKLEAIADAIREKTHKNNLMTLDEMPDEIASISGGGGNVPECGIVPTSWASNGFVLTADSYGDIMPFALSSGTSDAIYPDDSHDVTLPGSIDISTVTVSSTSEGTGSQIFNYLQSVTFATAPESIGGYAFDSQYRLAITELPESVEIIGDFAFSNCYSMTISTIPESIETIGDYAFSNANKPEEITPYYDETSTYSIGDVVWNNNDNYTCIIDIDEPEPFNSDHWMNGYYPDILGIYDPSTTYSNGDIVCVDVYTAYTCCIVRVEVSDEWVDQYVPEILGAFVPGHSYNPGDVVYSSDNYDVFTCVSPITSSYIDDYSWRRGYYPGLKGLYDTTESYQIGDVVIAGDACDAGIYTCIVPTSGEFNISHWAVGYGPEILGVYDPDHSYSVGDIVGYNKSDGCIICTVLGPDESDIYDGYYPEITLFDDTASYNYGDVVYYNYSVYTCIYPAGPGTDPSSDSTYWEYGYYPELMGQYDPNHTYSIGDVVWRDGQVETIYQLGQIVEDLRLIDAYVPELIEYYNPRHTYGPGDIVGYIENDDLEAYICTSPTTVTGEFDSSYWVCLTDSSSDSFVKTPLRFLGTPNRIGTSAFEESGYNLIFVPWSEGSGPYIDDYYGRIIIYNYHPEES